MGETGGEARGAAPVAYEAMTLLAAAVVVHDLDRRRVLLLRRGPGARYGDGLWDLPAGKSDPGEPISRTAVRELYEETGVRVEPRDLEVVHVLHGAHGTQSPNGYLTVVFAAHRWTGTAENREPGKHREVRWFDVDACPREFVPSTDLALRAYLGRGPALTEHGWPR
ncbi:putative MutT family protein [Actinacidiphila reveromycinica]|uniref:Putative MutT family protein n=1 Tax=Actinacidiphila reveromycinica TaxID=659352 RepID=A0A7U3VP25_9ACTN|nr:putative MutT family protein [Streptomyces sp. SN-593]